MANPNLRLVTPTTENRTVTPQRAPNAELRTREHLTADEVEKLIEAAKTNQYGHRDALMVLLAYRHGLRAAEVVDLRWDDFKTASMHIRRAKNGTPATHPLSGREMRELRRHQRESPLLPSSLSRNAVRRYRRQASPHDRAGSRRGRSGHQGACPHAAPCLRLQARQRRPRHARDPSLSRSRNIQNTTRYTALAPQRLKDFFRD